jgi:hypothetical protein
MGPRCRRTGASHPVLLHPCTTAGAYGAPPLLPSRCGPRASAYSRPPTPQAARPSFRCPRPAALLRRCCPAAGRCGSAARAGCRPSRRARAGRTHEHRCAHWGVAWWHQPGVSGCVGCPYVRFSRGWQEALWRALHALCICLPHRRRLALLSRALLHALSALPPILIGGWPKPRAGSGAAAAGLSACRRIQGARPRRLLGPRRLSRRVQGGGAAGRAWRR